MEDLRVGWACGWMSLEREGERECEWRFVVDFSSMIVARKAGEVV
jgi:hypothetical protein